MYLLVTNNASYDKITKIFEEIASSIKDCINVLNKTNKMEKFVQRMIAEHKALVKKIAKLHNWVYGDAHEQVDAVEFANECVQLKAMKVYEEALRARLNNQGVIIDGGDYLVAIDDLCEEEHEQDSTINN